MPGAGRSLTCERERVEAAALAGVPAPMPQAYPFLVAEIGIMADTLDGVAARARQRAAEWTEPCAAKLHTSGAALKAWERPRPEPPASASAAAQGGAAEP